MCDLFERFVFKSCVFRLKPSNVAYKHASLVPRENDVREHKIFVGKIIVNLCCMSVFLVVSCIFTKAGPSQVTPMNIGSVFSSGCYKNDPDHSKYLCSLRQLLRSEL